VLHRKTTYQSVVFQDFESLGRTNYHEIIRFCERNRDAMETLNFQEYFIMELAYCNSLFQMENYEKHLEVANKIIELSIFNNVHLFQGEDIYQKTLFQKAQAYKTLNHLPEAIHITKELLKMNVNSKEYQSFLKFCYIKSNTLFLENLRGYGVLICFVAASILVLNILIIEPFYPQKVLLFHILSIIGLVVGAILLVGGLTVHHWQAKSKFKEFIKEIEK
jgi:tetratricopeptide (TPR) repeat protein